MDEKIKNENGRLSLKTEYGEAELLYKIEDGVMIAYHTFTPPEARGRGIAEKLAIAAVDLAKKNGLRIRPDCSYMKLFFEKHKELKEYCEA